MPNIPEHHEQIAADLPELDILIIFENEGAYQHHWPEVAAMPLVKGTTYRFYQSLNSSEHNTAVVTKHKRIFCTDTRQTYDTILSWINGLAAWILEHKHVQMDGQIFVNRRNKYEIEQRRVYADLALFDEIKDALHKYTREIGWAAENNQRGEICKLKQANIAHVKQLVAKWDNYISS